MSNKTPCPHCEALEEKIEEMRRYTERITQERNDMYLFLAGLGESNILLSHKLNLLLDKIDSNITF